MRQRPEIVWHIKKVKLYLNNFGEILFYAKQCRSFPGERCSMGKAKKNAASRYLLHLKAD